VLFHPCLNVLFRFRNAKGENPKTLVSESLPDDILCGRRLLPAAFSQVFPKDQPDNSALETG
jgi:hypothetical protein